MIALGCRSTRSQDQDDDDPVASPLIHHVRFAGEAFADQLANRNDLSGFPTPELRVNLGLNWRRGAHTAGLTLLRGLLQE
ncbi:MAG: hypothetical protein F4Y86_15550 [Gammaproteobacteria bacterium]|nr:hypothetical protein [Gammaproteobacteria bacterium]MYB37843.1 hypothetical protein [Gammaproteobacteria bacterium]